MCYENIRKSRIKKEEVIGYRLVIPTKPDYRSMFTGIYLPVETWLVAENVLRTILSGHDYLVGFKGFPLFRKKADALKFNHSHYKQYEIVKAKIRGNIRTAQTGGYGKHFSVLLGDEQFIFKEQK
jgi:hypothetical protein